MTVGIEDEVKASALQQQIEDRRRDGWELVRATPVQKPGQKDGWPADPVYRLVFKKEQQ